MPVSTIAAGYPAALLEFAVGKGADRDALLAGSRFNPVDIALQDNRAPLENYLALFRVAIDLTGDRALALHFGEAVPMQQISIVGLICEACEYAYEAGPALNRYARLVFDGDPAADPALVRPIATEQGIWITIPGERIAHMKHLAEAELARLVHQSRAMFANSREFQLMSFPIAAAFMHDDPGYRDEYERVFNAPVTFGAAHSGILVDAGFPMLKHPPVNRYVFGVLSERADALLRDLESSKTVRGHVERLLMPVLHTGDARIEEIAAKMGLNRSALLRRLKAEGTTYAQVVDDLRRQLAMHFLSNSKLSVKEVAYLLGFADPPAFSRAFKRWTGKSPRDMRERRD